MDTLNAVMQAAERDAGYAGYRTHTTESDALGEVNAGLPDYARVARFVREGLAPLSAAVGDTGRGIPPEAMLTLYEPFRRRHKPGEYTFSGSGLGLSICRTIVEANGGRIWMEKRAGGGTEFHFTLVSAKAEEDDVG